MIFGKLCLILAVAFVHEIGTHAYRATSVEIPEIAAADPNAIGEDAGTQTRESFAIITSRNIFGAKPQAATPVAEAPKPVTPLKLRLVGTQVPSQGRPFAIIEDSAKKAQDVFELDEMIFDQAKLVEIKEDRVQIDRAGKLEMLLMEDGPTTAPAEGISSNSDQTEFTVAEAELTDALSNLPRLLSQARAVPYFRDGKSIGMRLFAIRRGSLYEKLGLKNGDIVLAVNDNSLNDPTQALKLFEQLKTERSIAVQVERSGEAANLRYSIR